VAIVTYAPNAIKTPGTSESTAAQNDSPEATASAPIRIVPGLSMTFKMIENRSYQRTVRRSSGMASTPNCSTPAGCR
jgi:hypothetical protein